MVIREYIILNRFLFEKTGIVLNYKAILPDFLDKCD